MKSVFADAFYWIAVFLPRDSWHQRAIEVSRGLAPLRMTTTEEVLTEFLNFAADLGPATRREAVEFVRGLNDDPDVEIIQQSRDSFLAGVELYSRRLDKGYSLTDCISMATMRNCSLSEVLTHDHHFVQEGFVVLLG